VRVLSLKNNSLQTIPADIGRLAHLEKLYLTNNRLENW
jgi:Leucine-rich repeat (LRR) protein